MSMVPARKSFFGAQTKTFLILINTELSLFRKKNTKFSFDSIVSITVNESRYKQCGVTPHF